jgi:hypothetical protein
MLMAQSRAPIRGNCNFPNIAPRNPEIMFLWMQADQMATRQQTTQIATTSYTQRCIVLTLINIGG